MPKWLKISALILGPLLCSGFLYLSIAEALPPAARSMAALSLWMAIWWAFEAVPLSVTALLPVIGMPLLGIASLETTASYYAHPLFFLFLGSYMIASAMQRCQLHKRVALTIVCWVGSTPRRVLAGLMIATSFLSMWISNTAAALMMYGVALSTLERYSKVTEVPSKPFAMALMLGVAYAASIGGVGTLVGTPPNVLFAGIMSENYGINVDFVDWMAVGLPIVIIMLPIGYLVLSRMIPHVPSDPLAACELDPAGELRELGSLSDAEKFVSCVFIATVLAWIFKSQLAASTGLPLTDAMIAVISAVVLFCVPLSAKFDRFSLDWKTVNDFPLSVLLIFGGGLALATGVSSTGLADAISGGVVALATPGALLLVIAATASIIFFTEFMSNTTAAATFIPISAAISVGFGYDPMLLAVPVAIGASMAFMLPVATPPNTIIYAYSGLNAVDMVRAGVWLNIAAVVVISLCTFAWHWLPAVVAGTACLLSWCHAEPSIAVATME